MTAEKKPRTKIDLAEVESMNAKFTEASKLDSTIRSHTSAAFNRLDKCEWNILWLAVTLLLVSLALGKVQNRITKLEAAL